MHNLPDFGSKPEKTDTKFGWKTTTTKASNLDNDGIAARMRALAKQVQVGQLVGQN